MQKLRPHKKATIYCLSREKSLEPVTHANLLQNIHQTLSTFFTDVTLDKALSRHNEDGKDFIFVFCEGVSGNVEEGDLKALVDAMHTRCNDFFDSCSLTFDKGSDCTIGNILFVLKMKSTHHVEIFLTFPLYHFTLD